MRNFVISQKRGLVKTILLLVVALIILGYFKIHIKTILSAPVVKENLSYAWDLFVWGITAAWNAVWYYIGKVL